MNNQTLDEKLDAIIEVMPRLISRAEWGCQECGFDLSDLYEIEILIQHFRPDFKIPGYLEDE